MSDFSSRKMNRFAAWRGIALAVFVVVAGELFLLWQYRRLERLRIPRLEEQIEQQREEMEKRDAKDALKSFLDLRVEGNEGRALRFLTEEAVLRKEEGAFSFQDKWSGFHILETQKTGEEEMRFRVEMAGEDGRITVIEIVRLRKILGMWYVDSVQRAG